MKCDTSELDDQVSEKVFRQISELNTRRDGKVRGLSEDAFDRFNCGRTPSHRDGNMVGELDQLDRDRGKMMRTIGDEVVNFALALPSSRPP